MTWTPLKQFCHEEASRCGVMPITVYMWLRQYRRPGRYRGIQWRRKNARVVDIRMNDLPPPATADANSQAISSGNLRTTGGVILKQIPA